MNESGSRDKADCEEGHAHKSHAEFVAKMAFGGLIIDFISQMLCRVVGKIWLFGGLMAPFSDGAGKDLIYSAFICIEWTETRTDVHMHG
jgi:hypothetical protein